jgi:hypothetical protein
LGRSIDYSTAIQAERGIGDIKPLLKYFIALYYRQEEYLLCVYSITIARLIPSAYQGREEGVYKIKGSFA